MLRCCRISHTVRNRDLRHKPNVPVLGPRPARFMNTPGCSGLQPPMMASLLGQVSVPNINILAGTCVQVTCTASIQQTPGDRGSLLALLDSVQSIPVVSVFSSQPGQYSFYFIVDGQVVLQHNTPTVTDPQRGAVHQVRPNLGPRGTECAVCRRLVEWCLWQGGASQYDCAHVPGCCRVSAGP